MTVPSASMDCPASDTLVEDVPEKTTGTVAVSATGFSPWGLLKLRAEKTVVWGDLLVLTPELLSKEALALLRSCRPWSSIKLYTYLLLSDCNTNEVLSSPTMPATDWLLLR
jgi:hypothetical protein